MHHPFALAGMRQCTRMDVPTKGTVYDENNCPNSKVCKAAPAEEFSL